MPQLQRLGRAHTRIMHTNQRGEIANSSGYETHILYHEKHVVCFTREHVVLRNNGFMTMTTKVRMNQASSQFNLGYHVYQKTINGVKRWYVRYGGMDLDFTGGLVLNRINIDPTIQRPRRSRLAPHTVPASRIGRVINSPAGPF